MRQGILFRSVRVISALFMTVSWLALYGVASAQQSSSSSYQVNEVLFGSGGELNACSSQYCSKQSAGDLTVGNTSSASYQAQAGFNTDRNPYIEVSVAKSAVDLGVVSVTTPGKDYAEFTVKSYLASGYIVQIYGSAPTYASHAITALTSQTTSTPGTEQFGINLVANTTPSVGADPVQHADAGHAAEPFGFGSVATTYATANQFKYVSGDTIAQSTKSSGYTTYRISYMMNITNVTPAGTYIGNQSVVATSTF